MKVFWVLFCLFVSVFEQADSFSLFANTCWPVAD